MDVRLFLFLFFYFFFFLIYFDFLDLDWLQMLASPSSKGLHWVVGKDLT